MLRALVLLLFLANLLFYLWLQGWLTAVVGVQPGGQHEPERMARQVHPEAVRVLPPEPASAVASVMAQAAAASEPQAVASATGASGPQGVASAASTSAGATAAPASVATGASAGAASDTLACLEAGPYSLAERIQVEGKLKTVLRPGDWMDATRERPGVWMVYMGRYGSEDLLRKKEDELKRIHIEYTVVNAPPDLSWGLSLGRYEQRTDADAALAKVALRGVRSARLVQVRPPEPGHFLRVLRANAAMQSALNGLPPATWLGRSLKLCGSVEP